MSHRQSCQCPICRTTNPHNYPLGVVGYWAAANPKPQHNKPNTNMSAKTKLTPLKTELTYHLELTRPRRSFSDSSTYSTYSYSTAAGTRRKILCKRFVERSLPNWDAPKWIKLTLSPFPRVGYTKARREGMTSHVYVDGVMMLLFSELAADIRRYMPDTFWFKLEEWK